MGNRQSSPVRDGPQYFSNAHNFIIQNPTFGSIARDARSSWSSKYGNRLLSF
ncbi:hypothetical protein P691DRAFT_765733 [Macrolepiota fuliginosa MF-IS2]|uniref:Uncharacterized protein n=1 Tax=Macrolepiota fuliginosa MF-IS2 TaxID=1400762 RepID=A0A9P5X267_9AGAR|nr:hypothetical protein P691DRAFT_765733 [Macrolepiota fuliginosa MF-IS2]